LSFWTSTTGGSSEKVRITDAGSVGIGNNAPGYPLDVTLANDQYILARESTSNITNGFRIGGVNNEAKAVFSANSATGEVRLGAINTNYFLTFTTNGTTERARIDTSGRLLVGTSSATNNVYVNESLALVRAATGYGGAAFTSYSGTNAAHASYLVFSRSRGLTDGSFDEVASGDTLGALVFRGADGAAWSEAARIECYADGDWTTSGDTTDSPGRLTFSTTADGASSPTTRMVVYSNGNPSIENATKFRPGTDNVISLGASGERWTAVWAANGTIQTSDERAKTDISNAQLGSEFIKSLRPVSYKWIEGGKVDSGERDKDGNYIYESVSGKRTHWGFIAQEVKEAVDTAGVDFGGWVLTDKDDADSQQALRYDQFIAPLTKALQEALQKIETLEAKVAALEAS
jgi:hypothetical protein